MRRAEHSLAIRYFVAVIAAVASVTVTGMFWSVLFRTPYLLSFAAVALSSWFGGGRAGALTAILAVVATNSLYILPTHAYHVEAVDVVGIVGFLVVALLISAMEARRRHSEHLLHEARDELKIILDGVADGITVQDETGVTIYANQAAAALTGYASAAEMLKTTPSDRARRYQLLDENDAQIPEADRPRARAFSTGQPGSATLKLVFTDTKDHRWILLKTAPVFDERRRAKIVVNILQDVTERKRNELELRGLHEFAEAQRRRLDSVVNNLPGMIYEGEIDLNLGRQRSTYISPYAAEMFGYDLERLRNDPDIWSLLVHPDDVAQMAEELSRQFAVGNSGRVIYRVLKADGMVRYCESILTLRRSPDGRPVGTAGVVLDVTDRMVAEEASRRYAEELRRSNEELEQFAYVASHDLQEPLRMIISYLQLIEQRFSGGIDTDAREFIGFAVDGAGRMKTLINDLLTYSRVQRAKLEMQHVDMNDVVDHVRTYLQLAIRDNAAEVTNDRLPEVVAHLGQMTQLLQNLIANALKFRRDIPPKIHVSAERGKNEWIFAVRDNGIGFPSEYADRIFVIFQRLHGRDQYSGTGIGLAVCKKIVERHNGRIWVESVVGEGSTFYFSLPSNPRKVDNGSR